MNSKSETQASNKFDTFKLAFAVLVLVVAVAAFYYFVDYLLLVRVAGLLAAAGVAVGIALTTDMGVNLLGFIKDSRAELRKVVWPTRQETWQTSLAVILMVIIMGVFLWLLDMLLLWLVQLLIGSGG